MTQRLTLRSIAPVLVVFSLVLALGLAACFSEHATTNATGATPTTCVTPSTTAGATIIFIRDFAFKTASVHVKVGSAVAWLNCEPTNIPHTSTSDGGAWNSPSLGPDAVFIRTFPTAGTFAYHCAVHPGMKATVIVD
jgi:plastocyanin